MSNVETKRIRHTKYVQFMLEVEELIRNGWSFVPAGSTNFGVQLVANFQRSVKQESKSEEVKVDVKPETTTNEEASELLLMEHIGLKYEEYLNTYVKRYLKSF